MAELLYTPHPASIPKFLRHIQSAGVPEKLTTRYLETVSFRSKNDRPLITIMKAIGFIDGGGSPTEHWRQFRDKSRARSVMGQAIRSTYGPLFSTYPDANRKDTEAIHNFFSARSGLSENTVKLAVSTFRTLASEGDFDGDPEAPTSEGPAVAPAIAPPGVPMAARFQGRSAPVINVNVELHLPATSDAAVYEALFGALRKHVLD